MNTTRIGREMALPPSNSEFCLLNPALIASLAAVGAFEKRRKPSPFLQRSLPAGVRIPCSKHLPRWMGPVCLSRPSRPFLPRWSFSSQNRPQFHIFRFIPPNRRPRHRPWPPVCRAIRRLKPIPTAGSPRRSPLPQAAFACAFQPP